MTSLKKYDVSYTQKIVSMWCYPLFQSIWIGPILDTEIAIFCFSIFWVVLFFIFSGREKASIFIRMFLSCYRAAHMYYPSWLRYWARKSTKHHKKQGRDVSHIFYCEIHPHYLIFEHHLISGFFLKDTLIFLEYIIPLCQL